MGNLVGVQKPQHNEVNNAVVSVDNNKSDAGRVLEQHNQGVLSAKDYEKVHDMLIAAGEKGDVDANHMLGIMYENALGVRSNFVSAIAYYKLAGEQLASQACARIGDMYRYRVPHEYEEAKKFYKQAGLERDAAIQQINLEQEAFAHLEKGEHEAAFAKFRTAASLGSSEASFQLAAMCIKGPVAARNTTIRRTTYEIDEVIARLLIAAENNDFSHPKAALLLGQYYEHCHFETDGKYGNELLDNPLDWYIKASDSGEGEASYRIATLLREVPGQESKVPHHLALARAQGCDTEQLDKIEQAQGNIELLLSADQTIPRVQYLLGRAYEKQGSNSAAQERAIQCYTLAANGLEMDAFVRLAEIYAKPGSSLNNHQTFFVVEDS